MGKQRDCCCRCEEGEKKCNIYLSVFNAHRQTAGGYYGMTPKEAHGAALEVIKAIKCC